MTLDLNDPVVAQALNRIIEQKVDARIAAMVPRLGYGTVASVNAATQTASVYLVGSATATPGIRYETTQQPIVGDRVRVAATPGGDRYIEAVFAVDAYPKVTLTTGGELNFGPGNAAADVGFYRNTAGSVRLSAASGIDSILQVYTPSGRLGVLAIAVSGDSTSRFYAGGDASFIGIQLGPGNASRDVYLQRDGAGSLKITGGTVKIDDPSSGYNALAFDWAGTRKALIDVGTGTSELFRILVGASNVPILYGDPASGKEALFPVLMYSMARRAATIAAVANGTYTTVDLDTDDLDPYGLHDLVTNTSRITMPTLPVNSIALVMAKAQFAANTTGKRSLAILKDGVIQVEQEVSAAGNGRKMNAVWLATASTGSYYQIQVWQDSGGNLQLDAGASLRVIVIGVQ